MSKEIEIKFSLNNPDEVIRFLESNAKKDHSNLHQKDTYFIPTHRDFMASKYPFEWLRIRETGKGCSINYKHFYPENAEKTDYCDEFESQIADAETVHKILNRLDFKEAIVVDKVRSTWMFKGVEVAIDNVKNLGCFIELEAKTHFEDPLEGKKYIYSILKELNADLGDEDHRGYPYMMIKRG